MLRVEDASLLRGRGRFIDDVPVAGALHAVFLRSPHAHARLIRVEISKAQSVPGVRGIFTFADIRPLLTQDHIPLSLPSSAIRFEAAPSPLARDELTYVGEPVAVVVADSRARAEDAARLITLETEPLPIVTDPVAGLSAAAPRARLDCPDNLVARHILAYGDIEHAFTGAAHRLALTFRLHKGIGGSIESRGVLARFDAAEQLLTLWDSTQMPHRAKTILCSALGLSESAVRVTAPDVGGGFGPKAVFHPEELVVPALALKLKQPVKWTEDRQENFVATAAERDQVWDMEVACDADGRLRGIRGAMFHDHGANTPYGVALPYNALTNMIGPYILPACHVTASLCLTNLTPAAPTRGAGRPQGTLVMERLLDGIAVRLGIARDEIRRRNLIPAERMPYASEVRQRDGSVMIYDSGDYPECQRRALSLAGWDDFPARQAAARKSARYPGIGLANYVEATGRGPFESAAVRVGPSGAITVTTGATAQGQGLKSMLAQVTAEVFDVDPKSIRVVDGDTSASPLGLGAFASRQAVTAANAASQAARHVATKAIKAASAMLKIGADDLVLSAGKVKRRGMQGIELTLADIARALAGTPGMALPGDLPPGLAASVDFQPSGLAYTNGTHICEVDVDTDTGRISLLRYLVVHDCGRMINPMLVEGQVAGAVAHGIGTALFEHMQYDIDGQPLTTTLADYLLPSSDVMTRIEIHHMESPSPLNPLGVKGAAESGTIGALAAIASAVEDALRPFDITVTDLPLTPERLRALIARKT
ncbi:MAG TPA: xanthine dehydrogenase family protein molybdopterin-binding subunit [Micropepsaceae bacterium]|nr:xanthine dehydrogenase family protein molybdopterin-binding subunit [Micropepsaceae bacterium]